MPIEAPLSRFKKKNLKLYIVFCIVLAVWFGYDGYFSESFKAKHTGPDGRPDSTMVFNQRAPFFIASAAMLIAGYLGLVKNKKIIADERGLVLEKQVIAYDSIEKIDKTHFASKGFFIITYRNQLDKPADKKISDRTYDNLPAILEHLVAKIS